MPSPDGHLARLLAAVPRGGARRVPPQAPAEERAAPAGPELHRCPACRSELVHPVQWDPIDERRWRVERRCPDCEWREVGIHRQAELDRFDAVLDEGTTALSETLRALQRANMEATLRQLTAALAVEALLPEDF